MRRVTTIALLLALVVGVLPEATAKKRKARRYAWVGLHRGPLAPSAGRALETLVVDELDGYDSFRLVDAAGHPLDGRLLAQEAALVSKLKNEGIDRFLRFEHKAALAKFDQAVSIFESRLVTLQDYELLHDTLLAKAEAQYQSGERGAAKATLENLLALGPKIAPSSRTHPAPFVKLWDTAKREMGAVGRIAVECADPGCLVQVDGQRLGEAPLVATRIIPGQHYVVATWPHGVLQTTVRVSAGRETAVRLERSGPAEEARQALLEVIDRRLGVDAAPEHAARIAALARARNTLVATVKIDGDALTLVIARHGRDGAPIAVGQARITETIDSPAVSASVKRLCAGLFVEKQRGGFEIDTNGALVVRPSVPSLMYASRVASEAPTKRTAPPPPIGVVGPAPPPPEEDDGLLGEWWLWAIVGGVAVAGATVAGVVLLSPDPTTTNFEVRLP